MKTILTLILTFLISLGTLEDKAKEFNETCQEGYNTYVTYQTIDNEAYYLNIQLGEVNGNIGYSICFLSGEANKYEIKYISKGKIQEFTKDDRGDTIVYFVQINEKVQVGIYYNDNLTKTIDLNNIVKTDYEANYGSTYQSGNNQGFKESNKYSNTTPLTFVLSIVFSVIIVISIVIIIILSITKKGWFNQEARAQNAFNASNNIVSPNEVEVIEETREDQQEEKVEPTYEDSKESVDEEPKEVYHRTHYYDDEERDISKILQDKGFNTNYKDLSMDEKNKVMLELMRMKDFKEITNEEYRSEVIKLWS